MKTISVAMLLIAAVVLCQSQDVNKQIIDPEHNTELSNLLSRNIKYEIARADDAWVNMEMKANQERTFCCPLSLRIKTGDKSITRTLECGKRYRFYWNEGKQQWDVREKMQEQ